MEGNCKYGEMLLMWGKWEKYEGKRNTLENFDLKKNVATGRINTIFENILPLHI